MVGKKSNKAKDQGLQRTDNDLEFSSWPQVNMINQKNYYTEYLKRDDQVLVLRLQNEENRNRMAKAARDRDRALAQSNQASTGDLDTQVDDSISGEDGTTNDSDTFGSKIIVIHPGSQNLRLGLANDALPKTVPMVVARKSDQCESEAGGSEPKPKRRKLDDSEESDQRQSLFDEEFTEQFASMSVDLKQYFKRKGKRTIPNAREQAVAYNRKAEPEIISEHNDSHRIDWTEINSNQGPLPEYFTGQSALRIPDFSQPRYKLYWPIKQGNFNERDYKSKNQVIRDFIVIIEQALKDTLGLTQKSEWSQYGCVFVVPDLYERNYVIEALDILIREFSFNRVCFIQESLAASFGAGYSTCCVVDIGAQKTSICCVDEGMCLENSRVNMKFGGEDVTATFMKMMLVDKFPYQELDLRRRYDFLLAEELKQKFCTMIWQDISVQNYEFFLRAFGQDTRHYLFKTYDEVMLAPMGYFRPMVFDDSEKLNDRRKLISRSHDLYDGLPNDPTSAAQDTIFNIRLKDAKGSSKLDSSGASLGMADGPNINVQDSVNENGKRPLATTPVHEDRDTPQIGRQPTPTPAEKESLTSAFNPVQDMINTADQRDKSLPTLALDKAIMLSIEQGARGDERKTRDFYGGIIPIGGGSQINGLRQFLEEALLDLQPRFRKDIIVGQPPREIDPQVLVWKGASVFGKLSGTNDSWIGAMEYDRLGSRLLAYKCLWSW